MCNIKYFSIVFFCLLNLSIFAEKPLLSPSITFNHSWSSAFPERAQAFSDKVKVHFISNVPHTRLWFPHQNFYLDLPSTYALSPGTYHLILKAPGYEDVKKTLTLTQADVGNSPETIPLNISESYQSFTSGNGNKGIGSTNKSLCMPIFEVAPSVLKKIHALHAKAVLIVDGKISDASLSKLILSPGKHVLEFKINQFKFPLIKHDFKENQIFIYFPPIQNYKLKPVSSHVSNNIDLRNIDRSVNDYTPDEVLWKR